MDGAGTADAWHELPRAEGRQFWTAFVRRYGFRPGVDPSTWPGIREPAGSVTFDLSPVRAGGDGAVTDHDVNASLLAACQHVCDPGESMVVLDWQHPSYRFWPHRWTSTEPEPWPVPPTPNGDYSIFLTGDVLQGSFGHPWAMTLCVFGADLAIAVEPALTTVLTVLRRDGHPVSGD